MACTKTQASKGICISSTEHENVDSKHAWKRVAGKICELSSDSWESCDAIILKWNFSAIEWEFFDVCNSLLWTHETWNWRLLWLKLNGLFVYSFFHNPPLIATIHRLCRSIHGALSNFYSIWNRFKCMHILSDENLFFFENLSLSQPTEWVHTNFSSRKLPRLTNEESTHTQRWLISGFLLTMQHMFKLEKSLLSKIENPKIAA